jgi:hypothetical protein
MWAGGWWPLWFGVVNLSRVLWINYFASWICCSFFSPSPFSLDLGILLLFEWFLFELYPRSGAGSVRRRISPWECSSQSLMHWVWSVPLSCACSSSLRCSVAGGNPLSVQVADPQRSELIARILFAALLARVFGASIFALSSFRWVLRRACAGSEFLGSDSPLTKVSLEARFLPSSPVRRWFPVVLGCWALLLCADLIAMEGFVSVLCSWLGFRPFSGSAGQAAGLISPRCSVARKSQLRESFVLRELPCPDLSSPPPDLRFWSLCSALALVSGCPIRS